MKSPVTSPASARASRPTLSAIEPTTGASRYEGHLFEDGYANLSAKADGLAWHDADVIRNDHRQMLRRANSRDSSSCQEDSSEEDYDAIKIDPSTVVQGSKGGGLQAEATLALNGDHRSRLELKTYDGDANTISRSSPDLRVQGHHTRRRSIPIKLEKTGTKGRYLLRADDPELKDILRRGMERESDGKDKKRRTRFSDIVFTRKFTAFDRQNSTSDSPFHGFFTLFWLGLFLLLVKIAANNWKVYGSIFGKNEILSMMFSRDVLLLGLTDGVMCASTIFSLLLQKLIVNGYLSWSRQGWIIQNIWQALYLGATISWANHRDWPWTHTVFIVLHCLAMLMKQHSYAFYNGYLSEQYRRKRMLQAKLKQLEDLDPVASPTARSSSPTSLPSIHFDAQDLSTLSHRRRSMQSKSTPELDREDSDIAGISAALESSSPLDLSQIASFERIIRLECEIVDEEFKSKCSVTRNHYPSNLTVRNFYGYIPLPTVVYELEYPRQDRINWPYVAEKLLATFGVLGVMVVISQAFIYPSVQSTVRMKEMGLPLSARLAEFPWILSDLLFPFMMEYLLAWYVIFETILNVLAELTLFADRGFYADWWNSTSWDQFARDWNVPVHNFLLRHVYHSSISSFRVTKPVATLITFFLSACVHELVMWCIFKKLRGYLLGLQMLQIPLVGLSRTKLLRGRKIVGNVVFWLGIFTGPSFLCSLYLII